VTAPLLEVLGLAASYPGQPARARVLRGVDLRVDEGEVLGLVGESGCGKSTLARCLLRLQPRDAGQVRWGGVPAGRLSRRELGRAVQLIFQDPHASLDPRLTVGEALAEPLLIHRLARGRAEREQRIARLLAQVGLPAELSARYPHELSGGQRQRVGIARALAVAPRLIIADEPVSALDLSVQAQIVNLLGALQREAGVAYLLISHDLRLVRHLCQRVAVMYLGRIVEEGPAEAVCDAPRHPYTRALLQAVPVPDPALRRQQHPLAGEVPSPSLELAGCPFRPRCPLYAERQGVACTRSLPQLEGRGGQGPALHRVACHEDRKPLDPGAASV